MLISFMPGDVVTYIDERGDAHNALVTCWWGQTMESACNLVYVPGDGATDSYGHERCHVTSVSRQIGDCPGRYWQPASEPVVKVAP